MLSVLLLTLVVAATAAARTSETVERVVMVRTTGSDLTPAATGFIYKKETDGRELVQPMHQSEIERHLARLHTTSISSAERVIPVSEHRDEPLDGLEHVDYEKILRDYGDNHDYLDTLKRFKANLHRDFTHEDDEPRDKYQYGKSDAKFESYSITDNHKSNDDAYKPYHYKHGSAKGEGFHAIHDTHKGDEYFGKVHAFPEHKYHGRGHKYGAYSEHHDSQHGEASGQDSAEDRAKHSSEEGHDNSGHSAADASTAGQAAGRSSATDDRSDADGRTAGKSYGYEIKH